MKAKQMIKSLGNMALRVFSTERNLATYNLLFFLGHRDRSATEVLKIAARQGADIGAKGHLGYTPLMFVAQLGDAEAAGYLTKMKVDLNATGTYKETALMLAAGKESIEIVDLLLKNGASFDARDSFGTTPLILAARRGSCEIINRLIQAGANVNHSNKWGETALIVASMYGHFEAVKVLVAAGADLTRHNINARTAAQVAKTNSIKDFLNKPRGELATVTTGERAIQISQSFSWQARVLAARGNEGCRRVME